MGFLIAEDLAYLAKVIKRLEKPTETTIRVRGPLRVFEENEEIGQLDNTDDPFIWTFTHRSSQEGK